LRYRSKVWGRELNLLFIPSFYPLIWNGIYNSLTKGHDRSVISFEQLARDAERHTSEVVRIMREERGRATQRIKEIDNATSDGSQTL
jgi:hypothetical protein